MNFRRQVVRPFYDPVKFLVERDDSRTDGTRIDGSRERATDQRRRKALEPRLSPRPNFRYAFEEKKRQDLPFPVRAIDSGAAKRVGCIP
jgi:hypothetical protein